MTSLDENIVQVKAEVQEKSVQLQQADLTCRKYKCDLDIANQQIEQLTQVCFNRNV